jgi:hypothetical protein
LTREKEDHLQYAAVKQIAESGAWQRYRPASAADGVVAASLGASRNTRIDLLPECHQAPIVENDSSVHGIN